YLLMSFYYFFIVPPTTLFYTLSLHDALPICMVETVVTGDDVGEAGLVVPQVITDEAELLAEGREEAAVERSHRARATDDLRRATDRKSTRLNSSHQIISYDVFCLKKKTTDTK